jgi:hypothetical protein
MASVARLAIAMLLSISVAMTSCALTGGTLGGREKCWPENDARTPSLWRGTLQIDAFGGRLTAPEGDLALLPGTLATRLGENGVGELVRGSEVVARTGDNVTLFGGIGGDGTMVVCAVEATHSTIDSIPR